MNKNKQSSTDKVMIYVSSSLSTVNWLFFNFAKKLKEQISKPSGLWPKWNLQISLLSFCAFLSLTYIASIILLFLSLIIV